MVAFYAAINIIHLHVSMLSHGGVEWCVGGGGGAGVAEMFCSNPPCILKVVVRVIKPFPLGKIPCLHVYVVG